ncbi:MAG: hypothetical protein WBE92_02580 [Steroidobacteraceae bacterium]
MRPRAVAYLIVLALLAVLVLANWNVIASSQEISFLVGRITAPLGVLILVIAALVFAIDLVSHAFARRAWDQERRRLGDEKERMRVRAEQAEESRVEAVRDLIERETAVIRGQLDRVLASLPRR